MADELVYHHAGAAVEIRRQLLDGLWLGHRLADPLREPARWRQELGREGVASVWSSRISQAALPSLLANFLDLLYSAYRS